MSRSMREAAEKALRPCDKCERTVPHAFEDPDAHVWDPNHITVNPTALIELLDSAQAVLDAIASESISFEDDSMRRSLAMVRQLRIAVRL